MKPNTTKPGSRVPVQFRSLTKSEAQRSLFEGMEEDSATELRSSRSGIASMVAQLTAAPAPKPAKPRGVGARHRNCPPVRGGGGYQDICEVFEIRPEVKKTGDPRLDELAAMGMPDYWLQVAGYLGMDAFLGMWRILDANRDNIAPAKGSYSHSMSLTLRSYSNYLRFQKNRFVENLAAQGIEPKEIQRRVRAQLCENISIVHIWRLARKHKIKS